MSTSENDKPGTVAVKSDGQSIDSSPHVDIAPGLSGSDVKMSSLHWFPWFPNRWLGSIAVKCMSLEERGAYRELLDWQWQGQGYLPADIKTLSTVVGFDVSLYPAVLDKFPVVETGKRANSVMLQIWNDQQLKHSKRSSSAHVRWKKEEKQKKEEDKKEDTDTETERNAIALHMQCICKKNPHGELGKVMLTDEEYAKLQEKHSPDSLRAAIEVLDGYIASKNKRYANHYAVLKDGSWVWDRVNGVGSGNASLSIAAAARAVARR